MLTETTRGTGRTDNELYCPECNREGLWQPLDMSACDDRWWCRDCGRFVDPGFGGRTALCYKKIGTGMYDIRVISICTGQEVKIAA